MEIDLYRCNQVQMKSFGWALIQYNWCSYKKREQTHTHRVDGYVKLEAEMGAMLPQTKEHFGATRSWKKQDASPPPPTGFRGSMALLRP